MSDRISDADRLEPPLNTFPSDQTCQVLCASYSSPSRTSRSLPASVTRDFASRLSQFPARRRAPAPQLLPGAPRPGNPVSQVPATGFAWSNQRKMNPQQTRPKYDGSNGGPVYDPNHGGHYGTFSEHPSASGLHRGVVANVLPQERLHRYVDDDKKCKCAGLSS